jgi:hypothetical protein
MKNKFMPKQQSVAVSAFTGPSLMTLYSYLVSKKKKKNFREPKLLGQMAHRLTPWIQRKDNLWLGWGMHYLVGLLFAETYAPFSDVAGKDNLKKGLVFGGLSGLAAILTWKFTLYQHPLPPNVQFVQFAGQLFIAHLTFGFFAATGFNLSRIKVK